MTTAQFTRLMTVALGSRFELLGVSESGNVPGGKVAVLQHREDGSRFEVEVVGPDRR